MVGEAVVHVPCDRGTLLGLRLGHQRAVLALEGLVLALEGRALPLSGGRLAAQGGDQGESGAAHPAPQQGGGGEHDAQQHLDEQSG
jgi:hypothetical protein